MKQQFQEGESDPILPCVLEEPSKKKNEPKEGLTEKAMEPHSSTFAWKIPWMEEPGRLQSMGLLRVGHD